MPKSTHQPLTASARRGMAYAALYVLLSFAVAIAPFALASSLKTNLDGQRATQVLLQKRLDRIVSAASSGSRDKGSTAGLLLKGATAGIVAAELQRQVVSLAQDSGLVISRMQSSTLTETGQSVVLQLQLESRGKIDALQKFLYAVESGKPFVFANEADISIAPAEGTDLPDGAPQMSLRLVLQATGWIGGT